MAESYENVQFKTLDGTVLRGRLYPAAQRGPAVILSPGYNVTISIFPPGVPEELQKSGITALVYDPRNTGTSGGFPRNHIDPFAQVEDYSDAWCYLSTLAIVDRAAIFYWGISLSAGIALAAASVDRRIAGVIAIAPIFKFLPVTEADARRLKSKMAKDREAQLLRGEEGYVLPIMESLAEIPFNSHVNANLNGSNGASVGDDAEANGVNGMSQNAGEEGDSNDEGGGLTHNAYGTTIQSYHRMFLFEPVPEAMAREIHPTPCMFLTPEQDQISPPEKQTAVFESLRGPNKRQHFAPGKEHVYVLHGPEMPLLMKWQVEFIWQVCTIQLAIINVTIYRLSYDVVALDVLQAQITDPIATAESA
ncbi:Alpha/Beta hydrolase protein [Aspergillus pseudoustus]|uniref:Alpha/Beta hydrolase protein n=1 Tax=Aspergillus pseudoustus TaxID=1810923 RepID=A0ABR4ILA7_9EURO